MTKVLHRCGSRGAWLSHLRRHGGSHGAGFSSRAGLARLSSGRDPVFWLVASDSPLYLSGHRPDVSISRALPLALASSGIPPTGGIRLAPPRPAEAPRTTSRLLRSLSSLLAPVG